ncbi:MAG: hypothetical protein Q4E53_06250 [Eubacteriales bacterium]|nr:hypothetical protein [Eubacteriales bacterium]
MKKYQEYQLKKIQADQTLLKLLCLIILMRIEKDDENMAVLKWLQRILAILYFVIAGIDAVEGIKLSKER